MNRQVRPVLGLIASLVIVMASALTGGSLAAGSTVAADDGSVSFDEPAATVLPAAADTYIDSRAPEANFGDEPQLLVRRGTRATFLRFDPASYDALYHVERAKLRLHAAAGSDSIRQLQVYGVPGIGWLETDISWNNAPRLEGQWLEQVDAFEGTGWYEADVTGYVNEHLASGEPLTFRIESDRIVTVRFSGRRAADHQPELVLFGGEPTAADVPRFEDGEDGSDLWLRYPELDAAARAHVRDHVREILPQPPFGQSRAGEVLRAAADELRLGFSGLTGRDVGLGTGAAADGAVLVGTVDGSPRVRELLRRVGRLDQARALGDEGFVIASVAEGRQRMIVVGSTGEQGVLYGAFRLLQLAQLGADLAELDVTDAPAVKHRMNNHWANYAANVSGDLGGWGTVERGYNGASFWQMDQPVDDVVDRYVAYARANASVGINGTVINNVNATDHWIRSETLPRVAAIADALRPYGVRVHLALRFDSPMTLGGLTTADPLDEDVRRWWQEKVDEIYEHIPDFGGFLVKGDSEGQPGPLEYGRTHAEGANMLAEALEPHGGIVVWRAFVYGPAIPDPDPDRLKQAYELFQPLDGEFADNVVLQTKNGPFDFQPREPVAPLLGGMPNTNTGIELPVMKEYTGHSSHANYLMPEFERIFAFDTYANGEGTAVSHILDGSAFGYTHTLVAGVANYGMDANWTRHPLDQANWYGFGRQTWDPTSSAEDIADEWVQLTFTADQAAKATIVDLLMDSGQTYAGYAQPLGLPIVTDAPTHFKNNVTGRSGSNRDTDTGLGYDRSRATGSGYVDQYHGPVADRFETVETTPEELLLFFNHLDYDMTLPHSGETVIQRMYDLTFDGVERVEQHLEAWRSVKGAVDDRRWHQVHRLLERQLSEAINFRNLTNNHFYNRSGIADERGRTDSFSPPTASVADQFVAPGSEVRQATSNEPGRVYLVPDEWGGLGKWEREARFELAADQLTGAAAPVERPREEAELSAPLTSGTYRLYAVDEHGNVSAASAGTVTVVADELHFDVAMDERTLLGGRSTPAEARLVNGLDRDVEFEVSLDSPDEWASDLVTGTLAPGEVTTAALAVTPPAAVEPHAQRTLRFTLTSEEVEQSIEVERPVAPNGEHIAHALDAGTATSPVLDSYTALTPDDAWDVERGFGWIDSTPQSRDRGRPDDLRQDMVTDQNRPATLRVTVPPGPHDAYVLVGDASANFGDTVVSSGGEELASIGSALGGAGDWGWARFELDGDTDGRSVDLEFTPRGATFWRFNALVLMESTVQGAE